MKSFSSLSQVYAARRRVLAFVTRTIDKGRGHCPKKYVMPFENVAKHKHGHPGDRRLMTERGFNQRAELSNRFVTDMLIQFFTLSIGDSAFPFSHSLVRVHGKLQTLNHQNSTPHSFSKDIQLRRETKIETSFCNTSFFVLTFYILRKSVNTLC